MSSKELETLSGGPPPSPPLTINDRLLRKSLNSFRWRMAHLEEEREKQRIRTKIARDLGLYGQREKHKGFKGKARKKLKKAIERGKIIKPKICEDCGQIPEKPLHGHHEDYNFALKVNWLCSLCHGLRHRKIYGE